MPVSRRCVDRRVLRGAATAPLHPAAPACPGPLDRAAAHRVVLRRVCGQLAPAASTATALQPHQGVGGFGAADDFLDALGMQLDVVRVARWGRW